MRPIIVCATLAWLLLGVACSNGGGDGDGAAEATATPTADAAEPSPTVSATPAASPAPTREVDMESPAFTDESAISTVGLDEVFFGMTADAAAEAAGTAWEAEPDENPECWFATPVNGPDGVRLMIWESTVERIDVDSPLITTRSGAGVGSTVEDLRVLFGERLFEEDPARVVFVPADEEDAAFRIIFDMADGVVSAYKAGRLPMVDLVGCP